MRNAKRSLDRAEKYVDEWFDVVRGSDYDHVLSAVPVDRTSKEGTAIGANSDWIIEDVGGEQYIVSSDTFEECFTVVGDVKRGTILVETSPIAVETDEDVPVDLQVRNIECEAVYHPRTQSWEIVDGSTVFQEVVDDAENVTVIEGE